MAGNTVATPIEALMTAEIETINRLLKAYGVQAITHRRLTLCAQSSFIAYGLRLAPGEAIAKIERLHRELADALSHTRERQGYPGRVIVRIRDYPLAIETPHPAPIPLDWRSTPLHGKPFHALVGKSYSPQGARNEYVDLYQHYHTLVAAMSGGGKSTLMRMGLISLAYNTHPADLVFVLVDLKNDDLTPFQRLPHVGGYAGSIEAAAVLVDQVHQLKEARIAGGAKTPRVLLVIDELAELGERRDVLTLLGRILSTGRTLAINVWAGTQYPTAAAIGGIVARSFTVRLVGRVDGAQAANIATQRPGSGAHLLAHPGDFLRIDGPELLRLKAYNLGGEAVEGLIATCCDRWGGSQAASLLPGYATPQRVDGQPVTAPSGPPAQDAELSIIVDRVRPLWATGAPLAAMIRAAFGDYANTGGTNRTKVLQAVAVLKAEAFEGATTTAQEPPAAPATRVEATPAAPSSSDGGKIIKPRRATGSD